MADSKGKSFAGQIKMLIEAEPDFPKKFKQLLVFESSKVANPFKFIAGLLSKGLLSDGPHDSEASFGLKEWMVQLAATMVCSKGADAIGGLMETLEESENFQLISALRTWAWEEFGIATDDDLSGQKEVNSVVRASTSSGIGEEQAKKIVELKSNAMKLIDKLMSQEGQDLMEQVEGHLVGMAPRVVNSVEFCYSLVDQNVLDESDVQLKTGPELQPGQRVALTIKAACTKKAMGSLVVALQQSGNELIIEETLKWLETAQGKNKNYPISIKSLANQRVSQMTKVVRSSFFEQPAPTNGLEKVATFNCPPDSSSNGIVELEFNRERMMACFDDGTAKVWNWRDGKETTIKFGVQVKNITCFQFDDEILILGTSEGTVYLFDARTSEEKFSIRLSDPVRSLKFVGSTLVVFTRVGNTKNVLWVDISRSVMRLLNRRVVLCSEYTDSLDYFVGPEYSFLYSCDDIQPRSTKSGRRIQYGKRALDVCWLHSPANISTLKVVDLISSKANVIAGCYNGLIATWNKFLTERREPFKILKRHTEAIVGLCAVNGHLLSLDKGGKLFMWSGYDLESEDSSPLVARELADNFMNVTSLVEHDRWFAACSSEDSVINIWTMPDLWLRTG